MKEFIEQLKAIIVDCGGNPDEQDINECAKDLLDCLPNGALLIAKERCRQIEVEGWTKEHDSEHKYGELAYAACCYASPRRNQDGNPIPDLWPRQWDWKWWKPTPNDRIRELVKAGALIAAEIDRLQTLTD